MQNTAPVGGDGHQFTGWCLDPHDLCVAKLCAFRLKDTDFVGALLDAAMVDPEVIAERIVTVPPRYQDRTENSLTWLQAWRASGGARSPARGLAPS